MTPWNNSTHFHSKHFMCVVLSILIDKWSCSQLSMHMFQVKERVFRLLRRLNKSNFLEKWAYGMSLIIMSTLNSSVFTISFVFELNLVLLMWTVFLYYSTTRELKNPENQLPCIAYTMLPIDFLVASTKYESRAVSNHQLLVNTKTEKPERVNSIVSINNMNLCQKKDKLFFPIKGTLMQIWKFLNIFVFIWK